MSRLFGPTFTTEAMAAAVSDEAWLSAMLVFEAELARAAAAAGAVPEAAAEAIAAACAPAGFDIEEIGRQSVASAGPVVALVAALRARVPEEARASVHFGATSQDVVDTAMMLIARQALEILLADLSALADACAERARRHRSDVMAGRTLLQQAVPITFGLKAAGWMTAVDAAARPLRAYRRRLALQYGGAAGTLAASGSRALEIRAGLARRLGLDDPPLAWHADRTRIAELGAALAIAGGVAGKIALDIALLAQTEVAEAAEAAPGGSSAMPHKRNPVGAVEADAAARGLAAQATILAGSLRVEHERAAGAWQAEWTAVSEAFRLAGGAVARVRTAVTTLRVDPERMRANLAVDGDLGVTEQLIDRALNAHLEGDGHE